MDVKEIRSKLRLKLEDIGFRGVTEVFQKGKPGTHGAGLRFEYMFNTRVNGDMFYRDPDWPKDDEFYNVIMNSRNDAYSNFSLLQDLLVPKDKEVSQREQCEKILDSIQGYIQSLVQDIQSEVSIECKFDYFDIYDATVRIGLYLPK